MDQELWNKISAFEFDNPAAEYDFSTRLANENYWTKTFTEQAIEEYKKFMYLAATTDFMVSPSEIVDTVWHQHLIFTQSYRDFCDMLGKQIQHVPSTHNKEDFQKFKQAKERTVDFYEKVFGPQPKNIWGYNDMFESLNLEKAKLKIRGFVLIGIAVLICLLAPAYFLLMPLYIKINNPYFIIGLTVLALVAFLVLEQYNRNTLKRIALRFDRSSFIYQLHPFELIYLKTQKISNIINGLVNELIDNGNIRVNPDNKIALGKNDLVISKEHSHVIAALEEEGTIFYPQLLKKLSTKPVIYNTANTMSAFEKYFLKSKKFGRLFYLNFTVLSILLLLACTRIITGIARDRDAGNIFLVTVLIVIVSVFFLKRLTKQVCTTTVPELYKKERIPTGQTGTSWQWDYFLFGSSALGLSFLPLVNYTERHNQNTGNCGTSCGSSCGSSCSSCGGCGGD